MTVVPTISELIHHLKRCPTDFLAAPLRAGTGEVHSEALVNDVLRMLGDEPAAPRLLELKADTLSPAELSLIQICCWLLTHPFFKNTDSRWVPDFLCERLASVAPLVKSELWVTDEERAEELARMTLHCSGYVPAGETREEALDRYDAVNTVKRLKVIKKSNAASERTRELLRKMAEQKAREAANVYGRE
jgi:hypothetical protein